MSQQDALRLPVVNLAAEHLAMGYLLRRNILTYKAPPNNEGYDLICLHPDPKVSRKSLRVQVKSRYQTDSNQGVPLKSKSLDAFDFLIVAFLNIGYYYARQKETKSGLTPACFYTLPNSFVRQHHDRVGKGWEVFRTKNLDLTAYRDELGFEQIAESLGVPYPARATEN